MPELLDDGYDIRTVQESLGYANVRITMPRICTTEASVAYVALPTDLEAGLVSQRA